VITNHEFFFYLNYLLCVYYINVIFKVSSSEFPQVTYDINASRVYMQSPVVGFPADTHQEDGGS